MIYNIYIYNFQCVRYLAYYNTIYAYNIVLHYKYYNIWHMLDPIIITQCFNRATSTWLGYRYYYNNTQTTIITINVVLIVKSSLNGVYILLCIYHLYNISLYYDNIILCVLYYNIIYSDPLVIFSRMSIRAMLLKHCYLNIILLSVDFCG